MGIAVSSLGVALPGADEGLIGVTVGRRDIECECGADDVDGRSTVVEIRRTAVAAEGADEGFVVVEAERGVCVGRLLAIGAFAVGVASVAAEEVKRVRYGSRSKI